MYRVGHKIYFEASQSLPASLMILNPAFRPEKRTPLQAAMLNKNCQLILEVTEKQASRYLQLSENSFARLIEDKVIVAN